jgi:hypothetical protein
MAAAALAASSSITIKPGDVLTVICDGDRLNHLKINSVTRQLTCLANTPTPTRTPTPLPPTATPTSTPVPTNTPLPTATLIPPTLTPTPASTPIVDVQPSFPIRAVFYYGWFPEAWNQQGFNPFTRYTPTLGFYDGSSPAVLAQHVSWMQYAQMEVGIASWWGQDSQTNARMPALLDAAGSGTFRWTLYYEPEGSGNPSSAQIQADLSYIKGNYGMQPAYLRVGGRPVIFVYDNAGDCATVDRWLAGNTENFYLVLKVFVGYRSCANQPDSWHQYAPAVARDRQVGYSYSISPGFWRPDEAAPRLARDLTRWASDVAAMSASGEPWQLVTTFNEWGEGTSIEPALEWGTSYLDVLAGGPVSTPTPTAIPTATPISPTATATPLVTPTSTTVPTVTPTPSGEVAVLVGAGDIASCSSSGDEATALLLDGIAGTVFTAGDNVYESGTATEFINCYEPNWGRHKARTKPAVGNHEYLTSGASGYYNYFGPVAAGPGGYYSYNVGSWHIIVLNSNCSPAGGCAPGSPQYVWLQNDLAANSVACTVAYWHHPRFTLGPHADNEGAGADDFWSLLYAANADVIVNGHDHNYQRWAPMNPSGVADAAIGIRQFIVGTGGKGLTTQTRTHSLVEASMDGDSNAAFGVLKLTLRSGAYDWQFVPVAGKTFTDSGTGACH